MDVQEVALVVFGQLVAREPLPEQVGERAHENAKLAFVFADAFMQASIDYRNKRASVAPARF